MLRIDGFHIAQTSLALLSLNRIWPLNIPIWHWPIPNHSQYCPSLLPSLCFLENRRQILSNPYLLLVSGDYLKLQLLTKASNYCFTVISTLQSVVGKLNVSHWWVPNSWRQKFFYINLQHSRYFNKGLQWWLASVSTPFLYGSFTFAELFGKPFACLMFLNQNNFDSILAFIVHRTEI